MRLFAPLLVLGWLLAQPGSAHADEGSYQLARSFGTAGLVTGMVGPAIALGAVATGITLDQGDNDAGSPMVAVAYGGYALTTMAPAVVLTSGTLASSSLRDAGASPNRRWLGVGWAGVGLHLFGVAYTWSGPRRAKGFGLIGWCTAMVAGVLQMAENAEAYRSLPTARRKANPVRIALTENGAALIGRF